MSFNGSGVFSINTAGQPVVDGTVISAATFNALTADLATGLSTCLLKNGTQTVTANIPMSGFKFTGLAAGVSNGDSLRYEQLVGQYLPITGGTLTGNLLFTDATYDIGATGATRPRDIFLSRNAVVGGNATAASITFSSTSGVIGSTTNNSAAAGSVGEYISSTVARTGATTLTTSTAKTVTSISLTAGDWDVFGFLGVDFAASTNVTRLGGSFSATTNVDGVEAAQIQEYYGAGGLVPTAALQKPIQTIRVSLAATTTYYLIANVTFTIGAATGYGTIAARRRR